MRLNSILTTAVIIIMLLSCLTTFSQMPFISQLEGLNGGEGAKITMIDGIIGKDYTIQYRLKNAPDWNDSPIKIQKSVGLAEGTVTDLEINKNYCFRLIQRDPVNNTETISNEACSITLKYTLLSDKEVKLEWSKLNNTGLNRVTINLTEEKGLYTNIIPLEKTSDTTFIYNQLECAIKLNFNINATFSTIINGVRKNTTVKSPQVLVDPQLLKEPIKPQGLSLVSINNNSVSYNLLSTSFIPKYELYKSVNGGEMRKLTEISVNAYNDSNVDVNKNQYCYAFKSINACGNISELSKKTCTVRLSSKASGKLSWTPLNIQADTNLLKKEKTEYIVQLIAEDGTLINQIGKTTDTTITIPFDNYSTIELSYKFRVLATMQGQLYYMGQFMSFPFYSYSNAVSITRSSFISKLEGLNEGKEAKITMLDGVEGKDYSIQYRLRDTNIWVDSPVKIKGTINITEGTITGLESNKNYCFRLVQRDSVTKEETASNEVCSIKLKSTILSDNAVKFEWNKIDTVALAIVGLVMMDEDGKLINTNYRKYLSDTVLVFDYLDCSKNYKFNITTTSLRTNRGKIVIQSPDIPVNLNSLTVAVPLKSLGIVSVDKNRTINYNIGLFAKSYVQKFEIYKSVNGGEMKKIAETSSNSYDDSDVDIDKNYYCYAYKHISDCDKKSELSEKACTVKLSSETYGKLAWTPFTIHADKNTIKKEKPEYTVQLIDEAGAVLNTIGNTTDTTIKINTDIISALPSSVKFRVLAVIYSEINLDSKIVELPLYSYSNTSSLYLILGNESSKTHMTVFPNPVEDKIFINSSGASIRFIELIDMKGQLIHKTEVSGDTINLSDFEKGKYILRLYDANKKLLNTKNIVKW